MSAYFELQGNEFSNVIETKSHVSWFRGVRISAERY